MLGPRGDLAPFIGHEKGPVPHDRQRARPNLDFNWQLEPPNRQSNGGTRSKSKGSRDYRDLLLRGPGPLRGDGKTLTVTYQFQ